VGPVLGGEVRMTLPELLADAAFEAGKGTPVGTDVAVHADVPAECLCVPLEDEGHEGRVRPEVAGVEHFDAGTRRESREVRSHPLDEDAGAEEPGERDDPLGPEAPKLLECLRHARPRHARVAGRDGAAADALRHEAGRLAGIGVGVGIRGAAGKENEGQAGAPHLGDAAPGEREDRVVRPERAAVAKVESGVTPPAFEDDRRHIGLRVAGGIEHQGDDAEPLRSALDETVEGCACRRLRQLEEAGFDKELGCLAGDARAELQQLGAACWRSAAVADEEKAVPRLVQRQVIVMRFVLQSARSLMGPEAPAEGSMNCAAAAIQRATFRHLGHTIPLCHGLHVAS